MATSFARGSARALTRALPFSSLSLSPSSWGSQVKIVLQKIGVRNWVGFGVGAGAHVLLQLLVGVVNLAHLTRVIGPPLPQLSSF